MKGKSNYKDFRIIRPKTTGVVMIKDYYFLWSKEEDMPISNGMTRAELLTYYKKEFKASETLIERKLMRVDEHGTDFYGDEVNRIINDCPLTEQEIVDRFCPARTAG